MQLVIPLQAMRRALRERMETHATKHHYDDCGILTDTRINELLVILIEDQITYCLKHGAKIQLFRDKLFAMFPFWPEPTCEQFHSEVVSDVEEQLTAWLDDYLPKYEWHIWSSQMLGLDLLITIGQDFRIQDWERRTSSGEWSANP